MLGLFTQAGCVGALLLLSMFYLAQIPTRGVHEPGSEGAYLLVNKNLIEAAAVFAVLVFRTGRIAGLDRLRRGPAPGGRAPWRLREPDPRAGGPGPPQFPEGARGHARAGRAGRGRGHPRAPSAAVRSRWPGSAWADRAAPCSTRMDPAYADVQALCDINPTSLQKADEVLAKKNLPPATHYADWKEMLAKEDLEGGRDGASALDRTPTSPAACMEAGKHVLCEKMMAWDVPSCERMIDARAEDGQGPRDRLPALLQPRLPGRLRGHREGRPARRRLPRAPRLAPQRELAAQGRAARARTTTRRRWGYPDFEHLLNWRLYWKYSKGLLAELASHQVNIANWFFGAAPEAVQGSGGVYRFKDGREVHDHVYAIFEYPNGRTATFSSIESNAFENYYEMYMGTKGTLILRAETEALFYPEGRRCPRHRGGGRGQDQRGSRRSTPPRASRPRNPPPRPRPAADRRGERGAGIASRDEISRWAAAIRTGAPLLCGPEKAIHSAKACILANEAIQKNERAQAVRAERD